jgi:hypothetical protein
VQQLDGSVVDRIEKAVLVDDLAVAALRTVLVAGMAESFYL